METFASLGLRSELLRALDATGHHRPTPIQQRAVPLLLADKDLLAIAATGTGKTAAFGLPLVQHLADGAGLRGLVLAPTRELAVQVHGVLEGFATTVGVGSAVVFGGVGLQGQVSAIADADLIVATPGRLLHLHRLGHVDLSAVDRVVLDECDRMLDDSFIEELSAIVSLVAAERQTAMFSATVPPKVERLASTWLCDAERVDVSGDETPGRVEQHVLFVEAEKKRALLVHLLQERVSGRVLVFNRTRAGADRTVDALMSAGIESAAIHGDKTQAMRAAALQSFRDGALSILVATDVASRGLHIEGVTHVVNLELPNDSETYVHRIGRTGRAGQDGVALSFCDRREGRSLRAIEGAIGLNLAPMIDHPFHTWDAVPDLRPKTRKGRGRKRGRRR